MKMYLLLSLIFVPMCKKNHIFHDIKWMLPAVLLLAACHQGATENSQSRRSDSVFNAALLKNITDSIKQYPDSSRLYFERGGMLYVMKEYEMAGKDIQKAIDLNPMKADYYIALGEIQLVGAEYSPAVISFRKALQLDPANMMARLQLSYTLLQQKDYKETILETDTLLKMDSNFAQAYGLQSQAYRALKDTAKALAIMKKAVVLAPDNYDVLMAMGDMLLNEGNRGAVTYYQRAGRADTTQAEPLFCIGLFYEHAGKPDSAVMAYQACISRDAYYLDAYMNLGKLYEKKDAWEKALKVYNLATEIDPRSSAAFYERGVSYERLNQKEAALNDYENAYSLERSNVEAKNAVERLRKSMPSSKK